MEEQVKYKAESAWTEDNQFELERGASMSYGALEQQVKSLQGKVLNVIEASIRDRDHQEAIKRLIKQMFSRKLTHLYQITRVTKEDYIEFGNCGVISDSSSDEDSVSME